MRFLNLTLHTFYDTNSAEILIKFGYQLENCYNGTVHPICKQIDETLNNLQDDVLKFLSGVTKFPSEYTDSDKKRIQEKQNAYCNFMEEQFSVIVYPEDILKKFIYSQNENLWQSVTTEIYRFNPVGFLGDNEVIFNTCNWIQKDYIEHELKRIYDIDIFKLITPLTDETKFNFLVIAGSESDKLNKADNYTDFIKTDSDEVSLYSPFKFWLKNN